MQEVTAEEAELIEREEQAKKDAPGATAQAEKEVAEEEKKDGEESKEEKPAG